MEQQLMNQQLLMIGVVILMMVVGGAFALLRFRSAVAGGNSAWQQLGYRPVDGGTSVGLGKQSSHHARTYNGFEVHYVMSTQAGLGKTKMAQSWACPLPQPARFGLQVIEAWVADTSLGAKVMDAFDKYHYQWRQLFPERVQTGDSVFDKRFVALTSDVAAARQFLSDVTVRQALLALKHVDLSLGGNEARFDDPFLEAVWGKNGQALVDVHNQIAEVITRAAAAAR